MTQVEQLKAMLQEIKDNELWTSIKERENVDNAIKAANKGADFETVMAIYMEPD